MTNKRPLIGINLTSTDKMMENCSWTFLVALWVMSIYCVFTFPEIIPIHFNGSGEADRFGDKSALLFLPAVCSVLILGMTKINQYPHLFNFPVAVTSDNAPRQYRLAQRMIRFLKIVIVFIFLFINLHTILTVKGMYPGLKTWLLPLIFVMIFIPTIWFSIKSLQLK